MTHFEGAEIAFGILCLKKQNANISNIIDSVVLTLDVIKGRQIVQLVKSALEFVSHSRDRDGIIIHIYLGNKIGDLLFIGRVRPDVP